MKRSVRLTAALLLAALLALPPAAQAAQSGQISFSDTTGSWCAQAVEDMARRGVLSGYQDGTFRPESKVTRGEAAKMAGAAVDVLPYTLPLDGKGAFDDIGSHWARRSIRQLIVEGIIQTQDYGSSFGPNQFISRMEMIRMLMRMLGFSPSSQVVGSQFSDLSGLSAADRYYCEKAAQIGLVQGYTDGSFRPNAPLTRGQAAVLLQRALPQAYLPLEGLSSYEEANTVPQIHEFVPVVAGSAAAGQGQYQGKPMHICRYTLRDAGADAVKEGLARYFQALNLQRYSQVGAESETGASAYLFSDLQGVQSIFVTLRQKDPETGLPSLTVGLFENDQAAQSYQSFSKSLGAETVFSSRGLSPAEFLLYADDQGVSRLTEVYDLSLLPAGASIQFADRLLAAGYVRQGETRLAGAPAQVYTKGETSVALSTLDGFWAVMLIQN